MIEFTATTEIAASPAEVWQAMTDVAREPAWMRAVKMVAFVGDPSAYVVGARMRRSGRFLWFDMSWESELVEIEPEKLAVFKHVAGALQGESRWALSPTASGCQVTLASTGPAPGPMAWFPALAAAGGRAGLRGDLKRLKRVVEVSS